MKNYFRAKLLGAKWFASGIFNGIGVETPTGSDRVRFARFRHVVRTAPIRRVVAMVRTRKPTGIEDGR